MSSASNTCSRCHRSFPSILTHCPEDGTPLRADASADLWPATEQTVRRGPKTNFGTFTAAEEEDDTTEKKDPLVGVTLGDYVIREKLGTGGMGVVYWGEQPLIGKRVAIKILRDEIANDPEQIQRLLAEARAVNSIRHRGIIDIFNFGQLPDGRHYVVMEFLDGESFDAFLHRRGALPPGEAIELLDEMLAALGAGHGAGIIHRDFKPSNVFVVRQPDGSHYLKLLDFGLAKQSAAPHAETPQTRTNMVVGTPEYIAPEQARGASVSPRTDIYAAGVVMFEMLTGRLPFNANTPMDWMIKHVEATPPAPSEFVGGIPPELDAVVLRMLAKEPEQRPQSAEVLRRELTRVARSMRQKAVALGEASVDPTLHRERGGAKKPEVTGSRKALQEPPKENTGSRKALGKSQDLAQAAAAVPRQPPRARPTPAPPSTMDVPVIADTERSSPEMLSGATTRMPAPTLAGATAIETRRRGFNPIWAGLAILVLGVGGAIAVWRNAEGAADSPTPPPAAQTTAPEVIPEPPPPMPIPRPVETVQTPRPPSPDETLVANRPEPEKPPSNDPPREVRPTRDDGPSHASLKKELGRIERRVQDSPPATEPTLVKALLSSARDRVNRARSTAERKAAADYLRELERKFYGR